MKNFFKAIGLWSTIDERFEKPPEGITLTGDIATKLKKKRYLDYKACYYLAIKVELYVSIKYLHARSSKEAWTILVKSYRKVAEIKKEKLQEFRNQFEFTRMRPIESIKESFTRIKEIVNGLRTNEEVLEEVKVVEKILQSLSLKFHNKKVIFKTTKDLSMLRLDDLKDELVTYEISMNQQKDETLEEASQEKDDQRKEKEDALDLAKINQEGQNSEIEEKIREYDLVARDASPKEVGISQENLFDGIEDEPSNERSKMVHQEKIFNDPPKFEAKIAWDPKPQQRMTIDIEDAINFVPLFEIACLKEHDKLFVNDIILQPIKLLIGVDWVYKTTHKAVGEVDGFKVKKKYVDDILKGFTMVKAKSYMTNIEEKLKLTKDDTRDFC
ncbi:uncharacterized protein [Nicotiana tomentosiformis]|uniref:uncharacterized protein n=1 Tax=Nicotiana tomentosiformis TaxID=4098 RepID=UPI00388CCCD3